jgi:dipeptidyl aminopeptidase/acylaminoacyl peptidase
MIDFFMDEQGQVIARERYDNETNIHRVESKINGEWVEIFKEEVEIRTRSFSGLTQDRKKLVMIAQDPSHSRWAYYTLNLADGEISKPLFSHPEKDVEFVITDINRVVHGVRYSGFVPTYEFFDSKLNARMRGLEKVLPNKSLVLVDYTLNFEEMVFLMEGEASAGDYVLYKDGVIQMITSSRSHIAPDQVNKVIAYEYKARDGMVIPSLLTLPNKVKPKNLPAIMFPHGGPESYDTMGFNYFAQFFANQGYAVIQPQFRGSTGFGTEHLLAGRGQWGKKMQDDLTDALNDLTSRGVVDANNVCIVGLSYGGYAAMAGATFTRDLYKCAVSINGVPDIKRILKTARRNFGKEHWVVSYWDKVINAEGLGDDFIESISPINHVKSVSIPILLIHGERDKVVNIRQSKSMYKKLKSAKKDVTYLRLPKGNHHLSSAEDRMEVMKAVDSFLQAQLH